jgi:hypothetical protein
MIYYRIERGGVIARCDDDLIWRKIQTPKILKILCHSLSKT